MQKEKGFVRTQAGATGAIEGPIKIDIEKSNLVPLVGINECGKTTILQAIYCFDSANDNEYGGKHLRDIRNLYQTKPKGVPSITAVMETKLKELLEIYNAAAEVYNEEKDTEISNLDPIDDDEEISNLENSKVPGELIIDKSSFNNEVTIERNLEDRSYRFLNNTVLESLNSDFQNSIAQEIISLLPYVLYNDDFMDRPPNFIEIPKVKPYLSGWLAIYERLFKSTSEDYSIFKLAVEKDSRLVDSIISDVESVLNKTLSKAWTTFLLSNHGAISIKLKFVPYDSHDKLSGKLEIKIIEKIDARDRHFDVIDRSKGFLWFFNFVMKLEFNPKVLSHHKANTIHLLDEPGSYLHYTAQEKLCSKLVEISKKHGVVIYCTHSHTLLNPAIIPLSNIYIIEKDRNKKIKGIALPQVKTKVESNNAYQPILEALQISAFHFGKTTEKIIAVEGIYDKYAIEFMIELGNDTSILPGTSANSIIKNIQFLNGFNKQYIAIWDNDEEGQKNHKDAIKFYGEIESKKFDLLPKGDKKKRRMEDMFHENDIELLKKELSFDNTSTYERLISAAYFSSKEKKKIIKEKMERSTIENFKILDQIFHKRFEISRLIADGQIDNL